MIIRSISIATPEDLLPMARQARRPGEVFFYWEQPAKRFAIGAVGKVWEATAGGATRFESVGRACEDLRRNTVVHSDGPDSDPLLVGGFAFDPADRMDEEWAGFPNGRFHLPRLCLVRRGSHTRLTTNAPAGAENEPDSFRAPLFDDAQRERHIETTTPASYRARAIPNPEEWKASVAATVADIRSGCFEKLVLARTCHIEADQAFDTDSILRELRRRYPTCTIFCIASGGAEFIGATPEPLVQVRDDIVQTAAIAGSIGRDALPSADRRLALDLTRSRKDREEHAIVVRAIRAELAAFCADVEVDAEPALLSLENVQHLRTHIRGRMTERHHLLEIAAKLHPSPAVGGFPRDLALPRVAEREGFERGWYAGPIGWMDLNGNGELDVALRCALVRGNRAALFAGAGIVADSDPEAELAETRLKLQPVLSALMEL
jgi:salicylate biosynthesis isochorismate synthase/menaquinone-specific isochorismate synthase